MPPFQLSRPIASAVGRLAIPSSGVPLPGFGLPLEGTIFPETKQVSHRLSEKLLRAEEGVSLRDLRLSVGQA